MAGAYIMHAQIPPAGLLKNIFTQTASVFRKEKTLRQSELPLSLWKEVRRQEKGVTVYDPDLALAGYTLVTNGKFSGAWLLDMNGAVVHQWVVPFRKAFPSPSHVKNPAPEEGIFWRSAWLFPNGDVIGVYEAGADTLYGYGMVKVDKDSNVIWRMAERVHHGVWVDEDGKVYALGQKYMKERFINDFIIIASPDGKELARISIWEAMGRSEYMSELYRLKMGYMHEGDVFHANSIRVIGEDLDGTTPFLRKGRIMVSSCM